MRAFAPGSLARRWTVVVAIEALLFFGPFLASGGRGPLARWLWSPAAPPAVVSRTQSTGPNGGQVATVTMGNPPPARRSPASTGGGQLTLLLMLMLLGRAIARTRDGRWGSEEHEAVDRPG